MTTSTDTHSITTTAFNELESTMNRETAQGSIKSVKRNGAPGLIVGVILALVISMGLGSTAAFGQAFSNEATVSADQFDPDPTDNVDDGSDGNNGADAVVQEVVFLDSNGNGALDPGEALPGVDVEFTVGGNTVTVTTDANGVALSLIHI